MALAMPLLYITDIPVAGDAVGGAGHAELKLVSGEGEGRRPVPVGGIAAELGENVHAQLHLCSFGYQCTLQTDTEVMAYIADYLLRRQGLTLEETASVMAAPFWSTIERMEPQEAERLTYLRKVFPSLLLTGPFSIILGFSGGLMALNDRLKLRSMVVGEKDDRVFISSEEAAIRVMEPDAENIWAPMGGEPVIVRLKEGTY